MQTRPWQFYIAGVLYAVQFHPVLDDDAVTSTSQKIATESGLTGGQTAYAAALRQALAQTDAMSELVPSRHGERESRDFLEALLRVLEEPRRTE